MQPLPVPPRFAERVEGRLTHLHRLLDIGRTEHDLAIPRDGRRLPIGGAGPTAGLVRRADVRIQTERLQRRTVVRPRRPERLKIGWIGTPEVEMLPGGLRQPLRRHCTLETVALELLHPKVTELSYSRSRGLGDGALQFVAKPLHFFAEVAVEWRRLNVLFLGQRDPDSPLSRLPIELVRDIFVRALLDGLMKDPSFAR